MGKGFYEKHYHNSPSYFNSKACQLGLHEACKGWSPSRKRCTCPCHEEQKKKFLDRVFIVLNQTTLRPLGVCDSEMSAHKHRKWLKTQGFAQMIIEEYKVISC